MTIKVLIADDDAFMRRGLKEYLCTKDMIILEADNATEAEQLAMEHLPDVVVMDIVMPAGSDAKRNLGHSEGLEAAKRIKARNPQVGIVLLSAYADRRGEVGEMIKNGAGGVVYMLKGDMPTDLLVAIRAAAAGQVRIGSEMCGGLDDTILTSLTAEEHPWVKEAITRLAELTPQELKVVELLAASRTHEGVATALNIRKKTVQNHVNTIYDKLGLSPKEVNTEKPKSLLRKSLLLAKAYTIAQLREPE